METIFELASLKDVDELEALYNKINDYLESTINYPGWVKDIYPTKETAIEGIQEGCLYILRNKNDIVSTVILRNKPEDAYYQATWQKDMDYDQVFVIYTFVVNPEYNNRGLGKQTIEHIFELARNKGIKSIRLDVYENNIPAINLYEKCGFTYIDTVDLGLGFRGLDNFKLYEKLL